MTKWQMHVGHRKNLLNVIFQIHIPYAVFSKLKMHLAFLDIFMINIIHVRNILVQILLKFFAYIK